MRARNGNNDRAKSGAMWMAALVPLTFVVAGCTSASGSEPVTKVIRAHSHSTITSIASNPLATTHADTYPLTKGKVEIYVRKSPTRIAVNTPAFTVNLVLVNGLGHSFAVPGACSGWLAAGLASSTISFEPAYSAVGCAGDTVRAGETRLSRTVETTYQSCAADPSAKTTADFPGCDGPDHDKLPPLPEGRYHLKLDTSSVRNAVLATPVDVTLTRP